MEDLKNFFEVSDCDDFIFCVPEGWTIPFTHPVKDSGQEDKP